MRGCDSRPRILGAPLLHELYPSWTHCCCMRPRIDSCLSAPYLQAAIKGISRAAVRMAPADAWAALGDGQTYGRTDLLPCLFEAFKHPSADVRKAVVFCIVDFWMVGLRPRESV
jgi:HEAT repeat